MRTIPESNDIRPAPKLGAVRRGAETSCPSNCSLRAEIKKNSEQMRRENLELFMERGRVRDYLSCQTTRMIMGDYDYLAAASGYVRGDPSGSTQPTATRSPVSPMARASPAHAGDQLPPTLIPGVILSFVRKPTTSKVG